MSPFASARSRRLPLRSARVDGLGASTVTRWPDLAERRGGAADVLGHRVRAVECERRDQAEPQWAHAFALALSLAPAGVFVWSAMNRSTSSRHSSSACCTGGDFMK